MGSLRTLSGGPTETVAVEYQRARLERVLFGSRARVYVGRYELRGRLGAGSMGSVYEAHDPKLQRTVALKVLRLLDDCGNRRLLREATSTAALSHPHIVEVLDVGARGREVYIAMELVAGMPLSAWLRPRRGVEEIREVFVGAAQGLAAAHVAGLVRTDFKPHNVLVAADGGAQVMDFGVASRVGGDTRSMTDPWKFSLALGHAMDRANGRTPHGLQEVLRRGLHPDPGRRFASMEELAAALQRAAEL